MLLFKISVLALALAATQAQDQCTEKNSLVNFMRCISFQMNGFPSKPKPATYAEFEQEYYESMVERAQECESNACDAGLANYQAGDFLKKRGILQKECKVCYKVVKNIMSFVTKSSTPEQRSCVRREIGAMISEEMAPCLSDQLGYDFPPFSSTQIPDFDVMADVEENMDAVEESITYAVNAFYQFGKCRNDDNGAALNCFDQNANLPKHCSTAQFCEGRSVARDRCSMSEIQGAACTCFEQGRIEAKDFANGILNAVSEAIKNEDSAECAEEIYESLNSPKTGKNMLDEAQRMIEGCNVKSLGDMKKYLRIGCKIASRDARRKSKSSTTKTLETIISLINAAIDAVSLRTSRFCENVC